MADNEIAHVIQRVTPVIYRRHNPWTTMLK